MNLQSTRERLIDTYTQAETVGGSGEEDVLVNVTKPVPKGIPQYVSLTLSRPALHCTLRHLPNEEHEAQFRKTLATVVNRTIVLLANRLDSISINIEDVQTADDPFWHPIELIVCLRSKSYALAETVFFLSENLYGRILEETGFLFIITVLSKSEYVANTLHVPLTVHSSQSESDETASSDQDVNFQTEEHPNALPTRLPEYLLTTSDSISPPVSNLP